MQEFEPGSRVVCKEDGRKGTVEVASFFADSLMEDIRVSSILVGYIPCKFDGAKHLTFMPRDKLKLLKPEKPAPKYKVGQKAWIPAVIYESCANGDYGDYRWCADYAIPFGQRGQGIISEADIKPRFEEPEKKEFKEDDPVWVKGSVEMEIDFDGDIYVRLGKGEVSEHFAPNQLKHRAEDE